MICRRSSRHKNASCARAENWRKDWNRLVEIVASFRQSCSRLRRKRNPTKTVFRQSKRKILKMSLLLIVSVAYHLASSLLGSCSCSKELSR